MLIIKSFFLSCGYYGNVLYSKYVSHDNMLILRASNEQLKTALPLFLRKYCYTIPTAVILNIGRFDRWIGPCRHICTAPLLLQIQYEDLKNEHWVAETVESILLLDSFLIRLHCQFVPCKGRHKPAKQYKETSLRLTDTWHVLTLGYMDQLTEISKSVIQYYICKWRN